jgi:hypothetical protein
MKQVFLGCRLLPRLETGISGTGLLNVSKQDTGRCNPFIALTVEFVGGVLWMENYHTSPDSQAIKLLARKASPHTGDGFARDGHSQRFRRKVQPPSPEGFRLRKNHGVTSWRDKRHKAQGKSDNQPKLPCALSLTP